MVTDLENYLFDLRGYLHLEGALTADEVRDLKLAVTDRVLDRPAKLWTVRSGK